jgi:hypothetical protein
MTVTTKCCVCKIISVSIITLKQTGRIILAVVSILVVFLVGQTAQYCLTLHSVIWLYDYMIVFLVSSSEQFSINVLHNTILNAF